MPKKVSPAYNKWFEIWKKVSLTCPQTFLGRFNMMSLTIPEIFHTRIFDNVDRRSVLLIYFNIPLNPAWKFKLDNLSLSWDITDTHF